jgi:RNA polymerase sigma-70 factor, ECF subfamily
MTREPEVREPLLAAIPKLRAFAIALCRNRDQADDLVQGTLLRAWANIASFVPGSNMDAWLWTILRNHFYAECRRQRRSPPAMDGRAEAEAINPPQMASLEYSELRAALKTLDAKHREAVMLVAASGLTYDEAARLCGCPVGTLKSRVNRARAKLGRMLSISGPGDFEADAVFSAVVGSGVHMPMQPAGVGFDALTPAPS